MGIPQIGERGLVEILRDTEMFDIELSGKDFSQPDCKKGAMK
jgi:hypothetical protein